MNKFLTKDELRPMVPAAFAGAPAERVSDRYSFISTERIIDQMAERGWFPVSGAGPRRGDMLHGTHRINFRHETAEVEVGGVFPELIYTGNHAGLRSSDLLAGFLKLACSNGLVVSTGIAETTSVTIHKGDAVIQIDTAMEVAIGSIRNAESQVADWMGMELNPLEQAVFASQAAAIRNPNWKLEGNPFLERRRDDDKGNDLWTVFNVVQENLIQGGVSVNGLRRRTRRVTAVNTDRNINVKLWELTAEWAKAIKKNS